MKPSRSSEQTPPDVQPHLIDWRGVGDLVALATERIAAPVDGMHRAIVGRWLGLGGSRVASGRRVVDGLIGSIYETVRLGGTIAGAAISAGAELASDHTTVRPIWETPTGRSVQSIFNGLWGDRFDADESPFRIEFGFRDELGARLPAEPTALDLAFPEPSRRVVVMLHGLGQTERCWHTADGDNLVEALEADGFSVLLTRYNTGRAVVDNGSDLADLLDSIVHAWPVAVDEIALVGHSMGGLVARSAIRTARSAEYAWVDLTKHLVAIGSPHLGSPIEKAAHVIAEGLGLFSESRPLKDFLEQRSAGIKDLRFGLDGDPEGGAIQQHFVAGAITAAPSHPLGFVMGDLVVRVASATGTGRHRQVGSTNVFVVGGRHHAGLLRHEAVHSQVRTWLASSA